MEEWKRKASSRDIDRLTFHMNNGVGWFSAPLLDSYPFVLNAFSTRLGGVSKGYVGSMNLGYHSEKDMVAVRENHRRFAEAVGYDPSFLVCSQQTHTDNLAIVTEDDRGRGSGVKESFHDIDGLITDRPSVAMMVFSADCVPLLILDPVKRVVCCAHSGWKGTLAGIGRKAVMTMAERFGSDPGEMTAAIGPSICRDCYEVDGSLIERFKEQYPERLWDQLWKRGRYDDNGELHWQLDLQKACFENFISAGMKAEKISLPDLCSCCNDKLLFSHRASNGKRGLMGAVIMLKDE